VSVATGKLRFNLLRRERAAQPAEKPPLKPLASKIAIASLTLWGLADALLHEAHHRQVGRKWQPRRNQNDGRAGAKSAAQENRQDRYRGKDDNGEVIRKNARCWKGDQTSTTRVFTPLGRWVCASQRSIRL